MAQENYGYRYPGGHSVIDRGYTINDDFVRPTKKKNKKNRAAKKQAIKRCSYGSLKPGVTVNHVNFGKGSIVMKDSDKVFVRFSNTSKTHSFTKSAAIKELAVLSSNGETVEGRHATRSTSNTVKRSKEKPFCWQKDSKRLIGCQVCDRERRIGIITKIESDRVTVHNLLKNQDSIHPYPGAFITGELRIPEKPNVDAVCLKQKTAWKLISKND